MTALPDDILREARRLIGYDDNLRSELMEQRAQRIAYALHATYLRTQKETARECAHIARDFDYRNGEPDSNYGRCISNEIRHRFLEGQKDERG